MRHKLYGVNTGKVYYACDIYCPVCKEWNKPGNLWKIVIFFPYHCAACYHAGYVEEFDLINGQIFVCLECKQKYNQFLQRNLYNRGRYNRFISY